MRERPPCHLWFAGHHESAVLLRLGERCLEDDELNSVGERPPAAPERGVSNRRARADERSVRSSSGMRSVQDANATLCFGTVS